MVTLNQEVFIPFLWKCEWEPWIRDRDKRIILAIKRVKFVTNRMPYVLWTGLWCDIIVLDVHAPTEDKTDYTKDSFYEELECVFSRFPKYDTKILVGGFNTRVDKIFSNQQFGGKVQKIRNGNGARVVNFVTSKNGIVKSMVFPHHNVHKVHWTPQYRKTHS
jgi:hypothetical protein